MRILSHWKHKFSWFLENRQSKIQTKRFPHDQWVWKQLCNWLYFKVARLDFFWGGYLPSLSISYVAMSKDVEKRLPQLYYIKTKISYDLRFIAIGVAMAT